MRNNKSIRRWMMLILWMSFIFIMSQQPGDTSSQQSRLVLLLFSFLGIDLNGVFGNMATFIVRKGAHFTEYFILYIFIYRILIMYYSKRKSWILGILGVFFYACTDEIHQLFIDGRVGAFTDVLIDTSGGVFSSIVMIITNKIKNRGSEIYCSK